jgi:DNA-binding LytR/AlgR family response regulator
LLAARPGLTGLAFGGVLTFFAYILVFFATRAGQPAWINLTSGLINAASLTVLAAAVIAVLRLQVIARSAAFQAFAHAALAFAFTYAWYLAVIVLNGIRGGSLLEGFEVNPFNSPALTWQLFKGLALYAVAAMGAYLLHYREALAEARRSAERRPDRASASGPDAQPAARRVMVRGAEGLISLDFDEVLYVRATGDGASLITRTATHDTRKTLTALNALLPEGRFVRAHRSVLVNREAILAAEPAGDGRLTLHLPAGESVTTSRAGARAVRAAALL